MVKEKRLVSKAGKGLSVSRGEMMDRRIRVTIEMIPADDLPDDEVTVMGWTLEEGEYLCGGAVYHSEGQWFASGSGDPVGRLDYWSEFPSAEGGC